MFKVKRDQERIEIPGVKRARTPEEKKVIEQMESLGVGESIQVKLEDHPNAYNVLKNMVYRYPRTKMPNRYSMRNLKGGCYRIWRKA
jgi:hypothetical protein